MCEFIKKLLEALAVVHVGGGHVVSPDELVLNVDGDVVLVTVIVLAVLLRPARLEVFLGFPGRALVPRGGHQAFLDRRVFGARIALLRHLDEAGVDHGDALRGPAMVFQIAAEGLKEFVVNRPGLEGFPKQPDGFLIRDAALRGQSEKAQKGETIADLELGLTIGQVIEALQDQHLEHQQRLKGRTTGVALLFPGQPLGQDRFEHRPVHHLIQRPQGIAQLIKLAETILKIKEAGLEHGCFSYFVVGALEWGNY